MAITPRDRHIEVRMRSAMRDKVGSAYLETLGAPSAEPAGTEGEAGRPEEAPPLNFEAAGTFAKRHEATERYAGALQDIGAPRPRYYAEKLAKEYSDRTITEAEPHPTRTEQVLTLSGEEAPKVTVLGER